MDFTRTIGMMDVTQSTRPEIFHVKNLGWYALTNKGLQGPFRSKIQCQLQVLWQSRKTPIAA